MAREGLEEGDLPREQHQVGPGTAVLRRPSYRSGFRPRLRRTPAGEVGVEGLPSSCDRTAGSAWRRPCGRCANGLAVALDGENEKRSRVRDRSDRDLRVWLARQDSNLEPPDPESGA